MLRFTARLVAIIASLRTAIAAHAARESRARATIWLGALAYQPAQPASSRAIPPITIERWTLLWHRLGRMANRFQALFQRFQANTLPAPRPSRAGQSRAPGTPRPALTCIALPRAQGWVNHRIPDSAACTGQLADLLLDPALPAFLARAPQAGRLLRPLCRALGMPPPPCLALPPRPRPVRPRPATPTREPTGDRPLPAYISAAARAWKKYDR